MILFDSNVLVAALLPQHPHFAASNAFVGTASPSTMMIAAHSLAEAYSTLTRRNLPYLVAGPQAIAAIDEVTANSQIVALSANQTLDAIRRFSRVGTGRRLYDYLIGVTGETFGARTIVTWNVRDFDGLFPALRIVTPADMPR